MSIELTDNILGIWFISLPDMPGDVMGAAHDVDDEYHFSYRFRYYVDDKIHGSDDVKNWYKVKVKKTKGTLQELITTIDAMYDQLEKRNPNATERYALLRGESTFEQFFEEFKKLPFVHAQEMSKDDYHKQYGGTADLKT